MRSVESTHAARARALLLGTHGPARGVGTAVAPDPAQPSYGRSEKERVTADEIRKEQSWGNRSDSDKKRRSRTDSRYAALRGARSQQRAGAQSEGGDRRRAEGAERLSAAVAEAALGQGDLLQSASQSRSTGKSQRRQPQSDPKARDDAVGASFRFSKRCPWEFGYDV